MKGAPPPVTPCGHKPLSVFGQIGQIPGAGRSAGRTRFAGFARRISFSGQDFPGKPGRSPEIMGDLPEIPAFFCPVLPAEPAGLPSCKQIKCLPAATLPPYLPPAPAAAAPTARPPHTPRQHGQTGTGPRTSSPPAAANCQFWMIPNYFPQNSFRRAPWWPGRMMWWLPMGCVRK